jgi:hypothetical protein
MKVDIGPYRDYFSPWDTIKWLMHLGVPESFLERVLDVIPKAPFDWIDKFRQRKVKIRIDRYDTWSMDQTLALIILPMLLQLQKDKHGSPYVDDEDVPPNLRNGQESLLHSNWSKDGDEDELVHRRWEFVLNEIIWSFQNYGEKIDSFIGHSELDRFRFIYTYQRERAQNGLRLFGKYYTGLWD